MTKLRAFFRLLAVLAVGASAPADASAVGVFGSAEAPTAAACVACNFRHFVPHPATEKVAAAPYIPLGRGGAYRFQPVDDCVVDSCLPDH